MTRGREAPSRWTLARSDAAAGGLALVRLVHPLLPELARMRPAAEGYLLEPDPGPPAPPEGPPGPFLVRLLGLAAFLHAQGLGVAPGDLARVGVRSDGRPALGAAPVPAWRALTPALLVAGVAARLAGTRVPEADADGIRAAAGRSIPRGAAGEAIRLALRADAAGGSPDALLHALWEAVARDEALGADLLGIVLPYLPHPEDAPPAAASGPEALLLARAAARSGERAFLESGAGPPLEDGGALLRLAAALGDDPRGGALRELARGGTPRVPAGPPLALVARDWESWDRRSRLAWDEALSACGLARVEVRAVPAAPWDRRQPLTLRAGVAEAAALLWLPIPSLADAVGLWERLARAAEGDLGRLLELARRTARALRPGAALRLPAGIRPQRTAPPALAAAAVLLDGFDAAEAARAGGTGQAEALEALASGLASGLLAETDPGAFRFAREEERRLLAARLGAAARRALAARLETSEIPEERRTAALLARGDPADLERARTLLRRALDERPALAAALLARAPAHAPHLGDPFAALLAAARAGRREEAAAVARELPDGGGEPLAIRAEAARALARMSRLEQALALVPEEEPAARMARTRVLLDARRHEEAGRLLSRVGEGAPLPPAERVERELLEAELLERNGRYAEAAAGLRRAVRLLARLGPGAVHPEAARSAGFLASDLGRKDEALALFRRALEEARSPEQRADALTDLAVTAHHAGRLDEALRFTDAALAAFAEMGDRERWISLLGNRADLSVARGDAAGARRDLETVLAHDRAAGREYQLLFALPTVQRLCLADADLAGAARAFAEACGLLQPATHTAFREALLLEARRLLMERRPADAEELLEKAGRLADNRMQNEPLRRRLAASAALDARGTAPRDAGDGREGGLLALEEALRGGRAPARGPLEELATSPGGHFLLAERVVEWAFRYPEALPRNGALLRLGAAAAARAGLPGAEELLHGLGAPAPAATPAPPEPAGATPFVAEDPALQALLSVAERIAPTAIPVLILGESGTGKEILARRVHELSRRRGAFVAVNVAALAPTLVEAELFGHAKGAFTGADRERTGLVEASSGGTLFLDEIGDLPLALQAKLLRVLQERELVRVGETRPRKVDLRVVAATHRPLAAMARDGSFRFDLYQRIAGVTLEIPPLRERPRDLAALLSRGLERTRVSPEARRLLLSHPWPGNVRELLSVLEAARALAGAAPIGVEHLPAALRREAPTDALSYKDGLKAARRRLIAEALDACGGNRTHAARRLGLSRQSLLEQIRQLKL